MGAGDQGQCQRSSWLLGPSPSMPGPRGAPGAAPSALPSDRPNPTGSCLLPPYTEAAPRGPGANASLTTSLLHDLGR